jgi:hypothetical protein
MFLAPGIETTESLTLRDARLVMNDLTNVRESGAEAFASLEFAGSFMGNAPLDVTGRLDPNAEVPTFDLDLSFEGARLVDVNPWLEEFLSVDAEQGVFSLYAELAAAEGRFEGYMKPIMENPQIFRAGEEASGPFRKAWEALVQFGTKLFENKEENQVATQVPLSGEIENPDAGTLSAIVNLLRNAFVAALSQSLEGTVSLRDVDPDANIEVGEAVEVEAGAGSGGESPDEDSSSAESADAESSPADGSEGDGDDASNDAADREPSARGDRAVDDTEESGGPADG